MPQRIGSMPVVPQVGDWGRDGTANQSAVASAMARVAQTFQPGFVISTGKFPKNAVYRTGLGAWKCS